MEVHNLHPELPQNLKDYISGLNLEAPSLFVAQKLLTVFDVTSGRNCLVLPWSLINAEFFENFLTEVEKELLEEKAVEVNLVDGKMREYNTLHMKKWDMKSSPLYVLTRGWNDVVLQNKLTTNKNFEEWKVGKIVVMEDDSKLVTDVVVRVWCFRRESNLWFALNFQEMPEADKIVEQLNSL